MPLGQTPPGNFIVSIDSGRRAARWPRPKIARMGKTKFASGPTTIEARVSLAPRSGTTMKRSIPRSSSACSPAARYGLAVNSRRSISSPLLNASNGRILRWVPRSPPPRSRKIKTTLQNSPSTPIEPPVGAPAAGVSLSGSNSISANPNRSMAWESTGKATSRPTATRSKAPSMANDSTSSENHPRKARRAS